MAGECSVGILIDLSSPAGNDVGYDKENENEDPNNTFTLTDCIEISRSDDSERRLSHTLVTSIDREDRILKDVTEKVVSNSQIENSPEMLIQDEIYDFDLMLSPNESSTIDEQEEEVFFGPVGFTEKLVSSVVPSSEHNPMSPLNPQQFAEIVKEAHSIAYRISNMKFSSSSDEVTPQLSKLLGSNRKTSVKSHQRKGTFELDKPVQSLLPDVLKVKIPSVEDQENVAPVCVLNETSVVTAAVKGQKGVTDTVGDSVTNITQSVAIPVNKMQADRDDCDGNLAEKKSSVHSKVAAGTSGQSRLKKPTKLAQVKKTRSYTLLPKVNSCDNIDQLSVNGYPGNDVVGDSDADSVVSDLSDVRESKLPIVKSGFPVMSESVNHVEHFASERTRHWSGRSEANSDTSSIASDISDSSTRLPVFRKMAKSSLPSRKSGIPGMTAKKQIPAVKYGIPAVNSRVQAPKSSMPATKAPIGKLQLVRPGQIQKSKMAFPRGKHLPANSGPVKAVAPTKAIEPWSKPSSAPIKSESYADVICAPSPMKPTNSTVTKSALQTHTRRLSLNVKTPIKSTSSSTGSYGSDTPSRRRSCLPTPTKQRLTSSSSIPPSPLTNRSSVSSNASTGSRRMLISDGGESPVFAQNIKRNKPATPRKPLVQNTPEVKKKTRSVWSPVRRRHTSEDQPFLCTKRIQAENNKAV